VLSHTQELDDDHRAFEYLENMEAHTATMFVYLTYPPLIHLVASFRSTRICSFSLAGLEHGKPVLFYPQGDPTPII
jgi:hypothetical protein